MKTLWRKRYKDKVPILHLWAESTKEPDDRREINQLSRRLATIIDGNPVLPDERETSLISWRLEEVQRRTYPGVVNDPTIQYWGVLGSIDY